MPEENIAVRVIGDIVIGTSEVGEVLRGEGFGPRYVQNGDGVPDSFLKQLLLGCSRAKEMAFTLLPSL